MAMENYNHLREFINENLTKSKCAEECLIFLYNNKEKSYTYNEIWANIKNNITLLGSTPDQTCATEIRRYTENSPISIKRSPSLFVITNLDAREDVQKFQLLKVIRVKLDNLLESKNLNLEIWTCPKISCRHYKIEIKRNDNNVIDGSTYRKVIIHFLQHLNKNNIYFGATDIYDIFLENTPDNLLSNEDKGGYPDYGYGYEATVWKTQIRSTLGSIKREGYIDTDELDHIPKKYNLDITDKRKSRTRKRTNNFFQKFKIFDDWEVYPLKKIISKEMKEDSIEFTILTPTSKSPFLEIKNKNLTRNSHGQIQKKEVYDFFKRKTGEIDDKFTFKLKYFSSINQKIYENNVNATIKGKDSYAILLITYLKDLINKGYCTSADLLPGNILKFTKIKDEDGFLLEIIRVDLKREKEQLKKDFKKVEKKEREKRIALSKDIIQENAEFVINRLNKTQFESQSPSNFEEALKNAFEILGFEAEHIGGSGDTDILLAANIGIEKFKVIIDAKTNKDGKIIDRAIDWESLKDHKKKNRADFVVVVGPNFAGGNLKERADRFNVGLLKTEELIKLIRFHSNCPFTLMELKNLFSDKVDLTPQLESIISLNRNRRKLLEQFKIIIREMQFLQNQRNYFNIDSLAARDSIIDHDIGQENLQNIIYILKSPLIKVVEEIPDKEGNYIITINVKDIANIFQQISNLLIESEKGKPEENEYDK